MGSAPSAIYIVEHSAGWKVEDFRIEDATFDRAERGFTYPRTDICKAFRSRVEEELGGDPGFILYGDLEFTKRRDVPTSAELPPMMKPAGSLLQEIRSITFGSRR